MFTFDTAIDTVQTGKKQFVKTFVNNEKIADALNEFIDAQTQYTKQAVSISTKTATTLGKEALNAMETAVKFDYVKLNSDVLKAFQAFTKPAK
jgi:anaerobic ribonucleoside-triphosphate reductase